MGYNEQRSTWRTFRLNDEAFGYLAQAGVSQLTRTKLLPLPRDQTVDEATFQHWLSSVVPEVGDQTRKWILDAAVAAYHAQTEWPIVRLLVCDGALQFSWVTQIWRVRSGAGAALPGWAEKRVSRA